MDKLFAEKWMYAAIGVYGASPAQAAIAARDMNAYNILQNTQPKKEKTLEFLKRTIGL